MGLFKSKQKYQQVQQSQSNNVENSSLQNNEKQEKQSPVSPAPTAIPPYAQQNIIQPPNLKKFKICTKCKQYIPKKASKCPYCRASQGISCSGMLGALVFLGVAFLVFKILTSSGGSSPRVSQTASIPSMEEYVQMCETIDYETLSRNPDKYKGKDFQFTGKVVQVVEYGKGNVDLRINVTKGDYFWTDTIYATVTVPSGSDRILEDDIITIYGKCQGLYSYKSAVGVQISIPQIDIYYYST